MEVTLLGGLSIDGCIENKAKFRNLNGWIEQSLIEVDNQQDRIELVSQILDICLESIGDIRSSREMVDELCVADRQYLMLRLASILSGENVWYEISCRECDATFDINVNRNELPYEMAGEGFPFVDMEFNNNNIRLKIPSGNDQLSIKKLSESEVLEALLERCIYSINDQHPDRKFVRSLDEDELELIDDALDKVSPSLCDSLSVSCPECGISQNVKLDHYDIGKLNKNYFYEEIHVIASHYHWGEESILSMSRDKRKLYIDLINSSSGVYE